MGTLPSSHSSRVWRVGFEFGSWGSSRRGVRTCGSRSSPGVGARKQQAYHRVADDEAVDPDDDPFDEKAEIDHELPE